MVKALFLTTRMQSELADGGKFFIIYHNMAHTEEELKRIGEPKNMNTVFIQILILRLFLLA